MFCFFLPQEQPWTENLSSLATSRIPSTFFIILKAYEIHPANEVQVRIQYKCLVPIYVFPEMKLFSLLISKTEL
jgi:hypothetical protein